MREAAAEERFEDAARYRNRLPRSSGSPSARRSSGGRSARSTWSASPSGPQRAAVQVFPLRDGRMVDRYSFHLENAAGEEVGEVLEQFCLEYYGSRAVDPPQILVPRAQATCRRSRRSCPSCAARTWRCARPSAARSAGCQELAQQNAELALESETFVAETKRLRASRRSRSCARC
jgi:excinuclease ABC subunit C